MKTLAIWISALLLCASAAHAQTAPVPQAPLAPLYQALGEKPGIAALMGDFVDRMKANARIGKLFDEIKPAYLKEQLTDQICELSGGPCKYEGEEMKKSHEKLGIDKAQFNLVVEILQAAMDARAIPFSTQNQLLAKLAPMHRDIITVQ
ncbi:hemoglobin [Rhodoferax ferrireducens]|uniref:Hemoglobin n=1 Tax=Rhodoferax ferrireducens TaxID=192843 RepID=A0ABU2C4C7_9BURK|nr:group 1 truncated hemoglobin [Rhodoferax ferrireducens]MDR7376188.1 hemoglobin [Rhodoferax ferrireducens]